jgi:hypothetical protein
MTLDPTAREANCIDSIKKYLIDNLYTTEGICLSFDKVLSTPNIQGIAVDRWVGVQFGSIDMDSLSTLTIDLFLCTRKDPEYFRLAQLRDTVLGYLTDNTHTDSMARIPLYRSYASQAWELLSGGFVVQRVIEGQRCELEDLTKVKQLTCILRWGAKI